MRSVVKQLTFLFWLVAQLSGCAPASTGIKYPQLEATDANTRVMYIYYQDFGTFNTSHMQTTIYMDGKGIVTLGQNMFTRIGIEPGTHTFTTSTDTLWGCHGTFAPSFTWPPVEVTIDAPGSYFLKFSTKNYSQNHMAPICDRHLMSVSNTEAQAEIAGTNYVKPD